MKTLLTCAVLSFLVLAGTRASTPTRPGLEPERVDTNHSTCVNYPEIRFVSTRVTEAEDARLEVIGDLTVRGRHRRRLHRPRPGRDDPRPGPPALTRDSE